MTWKVKTSLISVFLICALQARGRDIVFSWPMLVNRAGAQDKALLSEIEHRIVTVINYVDHARVAGPSQRAVGPFGWWPGQGGIDLWAYRGMGVDYVITGWIDRKKCALRVINTTNGQVLFKWHGLPFEVYGFLRELVPRIGLAPPPFGSLILFSYRVPGSLDKKIMSIEFPSGRVSRLHAPKGLNIFPSWYRDRAAYITYTRGGPMIRLGNHLLGLPGNPMGFAASRDNKRLAIALNKNDNTDLYIMDTTTMAMRRITTSPAIDTSPAWSGDDSKLVFVSDRTGSPQLWVIDDLAAPQPKDLDLPGSYNTSPDWAANSDLIAFQTRTGLSFRVCVYRLGTGALNCLPLTGRSDEDPTFSPDGRLIAFVRDGGHDQRTLMIWDIQSGAVTRLSNLKGRCFTPSWEPAY